MPETRFEAKPTIENGSNRRLFLNAYAAFLPNEWQEVSP